MEIKFSYLVMFECIEFKFKVSDKFDVNLLNEIFFLFFNNLSCLVKFS